MASLDRKITAAKANLKTLQARLEADVKTILPRTRKHIAKRRQISNAHAPKLGFMGKILGQTKKKTPSPDAPTRAVIKKLHKHHQQTNRMADQLLINVVPQLFGTPGATPAQKKKIENLDRSLKTILRQMERSRRYEATRDLAVIFDSLRPSPPGTSAEDSPTGSIGAETAQMLAEVDSPSPREVEIVALETVHGPGSSQALQARLNRLMGHGSRKTHKRRRRKHRRHQTKHKRKRRKRRKRCKPTRRNRRRKCRKTRRR